MKSVGAKVTLAGRPREDPMRSKEKDLGGSRVAAMAVLVEKSMEKFSASMVGNPIIVLTETSGPRAKEMRMGFPRESQYGV